jgi:hypothetical protein
MAMDESRI